MIVLAVAAAAAAAVALAAAVAVIAATAVAVPLAVAVAAAVGTVTRNQPINNLIGLRTFPGHRLASEAHLIRGRAANYQAQLEILFPCFRGIILPPLPARP